jgi:hypothetical protein
MKSGTLGTPCGVQGGVQSSRQEVKQVTMREHSSKKLHFCQSNTRQVMARKAGTGETRIESRERFNLSVAWNLPAVEMNVSFQVQAEGNEYLLGRRTNSLSISPHLTTCLHTGIFLSRVTQPSLMDLWFDHASYGLVGIARVSLSRQTGEIGIQTVPEAWPLSGQLSSLGDKWSAEVESKIRCCSHVELAMKRVMLRPREQSLEETRLGSQTTT